MTVCFQDYLSKQTESRHRHNTSKKHKHTFCLFMSVAIWAHIQGASLSSAMPAKSSDSSSGSSSSSSDDVWTDNEGSSTDCEAEFPATGHLRGRVALVVASCPRQYLRDVKDRRAKCEKIPADMEDSRDFLSAFRRTVGSHCKQSQMAACVATFHKRKRKSTQQLERKSNPT